MEKEIKKISGHIKDTTKSEKGKKTNSEIPRTSKELKLVLDGVVSVRAGR